MGSKRSRVHPKHKMKYAVANWRDYERALVSRGDITFWLSPDAVSAWKARPSGNRRAQPKFTDLAIETALTLRMVLGLPLRQTEGFLRGLFTLLDVDLEAPDHTTLSRRARALGTKLRVVRPKGPIHLVLDSTGLAIHGEGDWAASKHARRAPQGYRKLHLGVDDSGFIVAQALTASNVDDATTGAEFIRTVKGRLASVTGDGAYDTRDVYAAARARRARVVVPPNRKAKPKKGGRSARDRTIRRVQRDGRQRWKKESGYHRQGKAENGVFRYEAIIGSRMRARSEIGQQVEAVVGCNVLNAFMAMGRPDSIPTCV